MIISGVTRQSLIDALDHVNAGEGDNNVTFNCAPVALNARGDRFRLTLTVYNTRGKFGKRNPINGRRVHALCWHGHGEYFDALFAIAPHARIRTSRAVAIDLTADSEFRDWQEGSIMTPYYASEACECNGSW